MGVMTGIVRYMFLAFFLSHIGATLLLGGQACLIPIPYPRVLRDLLAWYASNLHDPHFLQQPSALWFRCFMTMECLLQLPYFFVASRMLLNPNKSFPEWFRLASLIYAALTMTSMVPVLAVVWFNPDATRSQRITLLSIYLPYLLVPLALVFYMFESSHKSQLPMLTGGLRTAMLVFFLSHLPTTIFLDSQALGTSSFIHPQWAISLLNFYQTGLQDPLMRQPCDLWFQSFIFCECFVQFPFFLVAIQQFLSNKYARWFPSLSLLYGVHVLTTLVPIYLHLLTSTEIDTVAQKAILSCIYAPYVIFPALLVHWVVTKSLSKFKTKQM